MIEAGSGTLSEERPRPRMVRAWDLPTRLFHWGLLVLIGTSYASKTYLTDPNLTLHHWSGYLILSLIVFRLAWGVIGGSTSRFGAFIASPWFTARYAFDLMRGRRRPYLGHNPLGTIMIVALFLTVTAQAVSGLFVQTEWFIGGGPLSASVSEATSATMSWLHHRGFNILLWLAALHVATNLAYEFVKRERVITAMVTGEKPAEAYEDATEAVGGSLRLAALVFALSVAAVLGTISLFGGPL